MSFRQIITITVQEGKGDEFAAAARERMAAVQQEPGCLQFEIFRSLGRPEVFALQERWVDEAAWVKHEEVWHGKPQMGAGLRLPNPGRERYTVED